MIGGWLKIFLSLAGLLIFCAVAELWNQVDLWNPSKFTKKHTIPCNSVEILSNACLYNIFETYLSYWGYLRAVNLQIYLETLSLKHANNIPQTTRYWALGVMLKVLPLVHFWSMLLLKEQMMTSFKIKHKKCWSDHCKINWLLVKCALQITTKLAIFYWLLFGEVYPENSCEISAKSAMFPLICP